MSYDGNGNLVNLLEKYLKLDENILRYQTIRKNDDEE